MGTPDKHTLRDRLVAELSREQALILAAARDAAEQATHPEARPENDKDTRGLELSYLAGAQAERARELGEAIASLAALSLRAFGPGEGAAAGALVTIAAEDGARAVYLLAPHGGGMSVREGATTVRVITPRAPLGAALLGRAAGESVEVETQQGMKEYEVLAVE